jgi:hypothetical protein
MVAAFRGRATEGAAFTGRSAGAKGMMGTATATDFTATEGVIAGSTAAGTSDNGDDVNGRGVNDNNGELSVGMGADGSIGPVRTEIFPMTCAVAGHGAARHATMTAASARLTSPL